MIKNIYIVMVLIMLCFSCQSIKRDSKIAIISDESFIKMFTGEKYKLKEINIDDLKKIDSLLSNGIGSSDLKRLEINNVDDLKKKYYRQYLCYEDKDGDKKVYINAFCEIPVSSQIGTYEKLNWKKEMVDISDGGNCYWSAEINLTKNILTSVIVNTEG